MMVILILCCATFSDEMEMLKNIMQTEDEIVNDDAIGVPYYYLLFIHSILHLLYHHQSILLKNE